MVIRHWLQSVKRSLVGARQSRATRMPRRARTESALVERLEDRTWLSATSMFDAGTGQLTVEGSSGDDSITVAENAGFVTLNGTSTGVAVGDVQSLTVLGGAGDD